MGRNTASLLLRVRLKSITSTIFLPKRNANLNGEPAATAMKADGERRRRTEQVGIFFFLIWGLLSFGGKLSETERVSKPIN